jgi:uncharacterized membrane protein YhfC
MNESDSIKLLIATVAVLWTTLIGLIFYIRKRHEKEIQRLELRHEADSERLEIFSKIIEKNSTIMERVLKLINDSTIG